MVLNNFLPSHDDPLDAIPDPTHLRWVIGMRYAEILILKKLLKVADSRCRLFTVETAAAPERKEAAHVS